MISKYGCTRAPHWLTLQPPDFDTNNQIENQGGEQKRKKKREGEKEKCLFVQRLIKLTELRAVPRDRAEVPGSHSGSSGRTHKRDSSLQVSAARPCDGPNSSEKFLPWDPKADWLLLFTVRGGILWYSLFWMLCPSAGERRKKERGPVWGHWPCQWRDHAFLIVGSWVSP